MALNGNEWGKKRCLGWVFWVCRVKPAGAETIAMKARLVAVRLSSRTDVNEVIPTPGRNGFWVVTE